MKSNFSACCLLIVTMSFTACSKVSSLTSQLGRSPSAFRALARYGFRPDLLCGTSSAWR
jgi:hypothetical protein